jgi:hypothetical protein
MMARAMTRLAQSHSGAVLGTSSGRLGAVKVYLDFGFRPEPAELNKPEMILPRENGHLQAAIVDEVCCSN